MGSRKIYNVRYAMEAARIYDETQFVAATKTVTNDGDKAVNIDIEMAYADVKSYSFNNSSPTTGGGVPTTLQAGIPVIVGDSVQIGPEIIIPSFEWGQTTTDSTNVETPGGSLYVPPRSTVTISYVGTKGTCNVPFSYTQRDSVFGGTVETEKMDGIFKGSNSYNFKFVESDGS